MRPARKRELVNGIRSDWGVLIRRACRVLEMDTSTYHYKSRRREQAGIEARIREICETRVRYGYRRVHVLLRREGWEINMKRTHRIYNELGLKLRNKTPKRRVKAKLREDCCAASRVNDVWAMDFVYDQLATGRKIRVLTVVDTFSRFSPVLDPRFSYRGEDVVQTLEVTCRVVGYSFRLMTSCSISLSRLRFATRRLSRTFSSSSCFNRFISDGINPPYLLRHR